MASVWPISPQGANEFYHSLLAARQEAYLKATELGTIRPFIYPWDSFPALILFLGLLFIPHLSARNKSLVSANVIVAIFYLCISTLINARSLSFCGGYGIGLMCGWGMVMTISLVICNDIGSEFQRVERRDHRAQPAQGQVNRSVTANTPISSGTTTPRRVYGVDGPPAASQSFEKGDEPVSSPYTLVWQGYPSSILHRMEWCADLMTTFRGVGWNWRINTVPPLDMPIAEPKTKLKPLQSAAKISKDSHTVWTSITKATLSQLHRTATRDFLTHYMIMDLIKTIMITDRYFLGVSPLSSPSPWPFVTNCYTLTKFLRLIISITGVLSALTYIFTLSALFFTLILPRLINVQRLTSIPLLEPSIYPPYWLPISTVLSGGLAALWGKWWHQMFRFGISEPSRVLISKYSLNPKGQAARMLQLGIAFGLSGFIHACASLTMFSATKPISGPFTFFMLQGVGIILQTQLTVLLSKIDSNTVRQGWVGKIANGGFVFIWLWLTGPLLANDFARSGIWLFEPVPVSLFRGLVWGEWLTWRGIGHWVSWHSEAPWYKTGIAVHGTW